MRFKALSPSQAVRQIPISDIYSVDRLTRRPERRQYRLPVARAPRFDSRFMRVCAGFARVLRAPCRLFMRGIRRPQIHAGPATAMRFRLGLAFPPRPCASASALRFRLGHALPPRPCASASALRFRLGLALPPRPCASASALRFRHGLALPPRPCAQQLVRDCARPSPVSSSRRP